MLESKKNCNIDELSKAEVRKLAFVLSNKTQTDIYKDLYRMILKVAELYFKLTPTKYSQFPEHDKPIKTDRCTIVHIQRDSEST